MGLELRRMLLQSTIIKWGNNQTAPATKKTDDEYSFEKVGNLYGKKVGEKGKLQRKWDTISLKNKIKCFEHIPKYVKSTPDIKYRKHFSTYLNNECWNDDIIGLPQETETLPNVNLGVGEFIKNGKRYHKWGKEQTKEVDMNAPPRPTDNHVWLKTEKSWNYVT